MPCRWNLRPRSPALTKIGEGGLKGEAYLQAGRLCGYMSESYIFNGYFCLLINVLYIPDKNFLGVCDADLLLVDTRQSHRFAETAFYIGIQFLEWSKYLNVISD